MATPRWLVVAIARMRKQCTTTVTAIPGGYRVVTAHKRKPESAESDHESTLPLDAFLASPAYTANVNDHLALIDADLNG